MMRKELQKVFTEKMNNNQRLAVVAGFFRMAAEGYRGITKADARNVRRFVDDENVNIKDDNLYFCLELVALRFGFIKWLNYSDDLDKYINTLADSLADIDYKNALGSDLEDVIYEIKIARKSNDLKEKIDLVSDFQENLLNLEIMERLTDCYYNNYYLITLNNEAI
ncbi:hypothetical protein [Ligilactobacillus salivarius]|uniref:hypothetical protein n=1 Tax=Ligilactobacillus salivarius TaxID=1624 RepID=UPI000C7AF4EA|nr:hypothetical protein [Ligilactobacillus salivarius]PLA93134.1 hypothetical protein CYR84_06450 [Ligilactobacillus salivarius]